MAVVEVTLTEEEFKKLEGLNQECFRAAQDAELEVQRLKTELLVKQKAARDYLFELSKKHPIDPSAQYTFQRDSRTITLKQ